MNTDYECGFGLVPFVAAMPWEDILVTRSAEFPWSGFTDIPDEPECDARVVEVLALAPMAIDFTLPDGSDNEAVYVDAYVIRFIGQPVWVPSANGQVRCRYAAIPKAAVKPLYLRKVDEVRTGLPRARAQ